MTKLKYDVKDRDQMCKFFFKGRVAFILSNHKATFVFQYKINK